MKKSLIAVAALSLAACSGVPSTTQTFYTLPLLDDTTIGGANYPIVVLGAENTGISAQAIAQNLRFPSRLSSWSSFKAVKESPDLINHAHLDIGANGSSTLTFLHGDREIGIGDFTLPLNAYADPNALGSTSATLISSMLRDSEQQTRSDGRRRSF